MQCNRINDYHVGRKWRDGTINEQRIPRDIIVIGASAGGVQALERIFATFPSSMPVAVGVVLHRGVGQSELVQVLGRRSTLAVNEPEGTVPLRRGTVYLAPPDQHLLFERGKVAVRRGPREHSTRPAVDPLFRSAAESYGSRVVGLLLTGCGEDGASGLVFIAEGGGLTLVQDPDEAYMPYMPLNAIRYDNVAGLVSLDNAASVLASLAHGDEVRVSMMAKR
jgi:two-component system chemotaxis response regulator CheB